MLKVFPVEDEVIIREALRDSIPRKKKVGVLPERAATDASKSGLSVK